MIKRGLNFFTSPGNGETIFQHRLEEILGGQHWHVQSFNDRTTKGVPDMSVAKGGEEVWMELKVSKYLHGVHDHLKLEHNLTAQQHRWLMDRKSRAGASVHCGVLVAWRIDDHACGYVSFITIEEWRTWQGRTLWGWGLSPFTTTVDWLDSGVVRLDDLVHRRLTPGWLAGRLGELPPQHPLRARNSEAAPTPSARASRGQSRSRSAARRSSNPLRRRPPA